MYTWRTLWISNNTPPAKRAAGFTLIELLLSVSTLAILLIALSAFLSLLLHARVKYQAISEVEQTGAQILAVMTRAIRDADSIAVPAASSSGGILTLSTSASSTNPIVIDIASTEIRIAEGNQNPVPLSIPQVVPSNLLFSNLSTSETKETIKIQFTLTHKNVGQQQEYEYSKTFYDSETLR